MSSRLIMGVTEISKVHRIASSMADNTTSPVFPVPRIQPGASIGIIGAGQVGTAAANAIVLGAIADEVLLVDINASLRDAQVRDLSDVSYASNSKTRVRAATHHEAGQCDIVVIATGSNISLGESGWVINSWCYRG